LRCSVGAGIKFENVVIVRCKSLDPLNQEAERNALNLWLNTQVMGNYSPRLNDFNDEGCLPPVQKLLLRR